MSFKLYNYILAFILIICLLGCSKSIIADWNAPMKNESEIPEEQREPVYGKRVSEISIEQSEPIYGLEESKDIESFLIPFRYNKKWGYLDKELNVVILPKYESVSYVHKALAYQCDDGEGHHIFNANGKELACLDKANLYNGRYCVSYESPYYILDAYTGRKAVFTGYLDVIPFNADEYPVRIPVTVDITCFYLNENLTTMSFADRVFKRTYPFNDGVAVVIDGNRNTLVIDSEGNTIMDSILYSDQEYSEGLLAVMLKDERTGYIDTEGNLSIEIPFYVERSRPYQIFPFREGVAAVLSPDKSVWTIIDMKGTVLGTRSDEWLGVCSCGLIAVCGENGWGYCDRTGKTVIRNEFETAGVCRGEDFRDGYVAMLHDGKEVLLDTSGNVYYTADIVTGNKEPAFSVWAD